MLGETINAKYQIESHFTEGVSGSTFKAKAISTGEPALIKFIEVLSDPKAAAVSERLADHWPKLRSIRHFGLVPILGYGSHRGIPFLVMPFPDGNPLSGEVELSPLSMERVIHICHAIGRLLEVLHTAELAHGDVSPANVILKPTWSFPHVALMGFGSTPALEWSAVEAVDLTYMSPEQALGAAPDSRSDLYSLGVIMHVLSTGLMPQPGMDESKSPPSLRLLNPWIPPSFSSLVLNLLKDEANSRPANAGIVLAELGRIGQNDLYPADKPPPLDESDRIDLEDWE